MSDTFRARLIGSACGRLPALLTGAVLMGLTPIWLSAAAAPTTAPAVDSTVASSGLFLLAQLAPKPRANTGGSSGGRGATARAAPSGQTSPTVDPKSVPKAALIGAMMTTKEGLSAVQNYLTEGGTNPSRIAARSRALLSALRDQYPGADPTGMVAAVNRVAQIAATGLSTAKILRIAVDRNFRPSGNVRAFKFGPPDMKSRPGFESVTSNDPRVKGAAMTGLRRPGDGGALQTGISGLEQFSVQVPNGRYRLILLTEDTGDPALRTAPFGTGLRVNGVPIPVQQTLPNDWLQSAALGNNASAMLTPGRTAQGEQGGGIVIETVVTDGRLLVSIPPLAARQFKSYISAAILEPADGPSLFAPSDEAKQGIFDLHDVAMRQSEVSRAVADVLSQVAPAAGPPPDKLPDPVFQSLVAASAS